VLVEKGFLSAAELEEVLADQEEEFDAPLGQLMIAGGYVSGSPDTGVPWLQKTSRGSGDRSLSAAGVGIRTDVRAHQRAKVRSSPVR
jgi:hypothetical protein